MNEPQRIENLIDSVKNLSESQMILIEEIVRVLKKPLADEYLNPDSDLVDSMFCIDFGDILKIHHNFSLEPFTKDKFEYALVKTFVSAGKNATKSPMGNPGHDIMIDGNPVSLKTQADKGIQRDKLHISKFMELGKGKWGDDSQDLVGLRNQFFSHLESYSRILSLRCLAKAPIWTYELVEIPKSLLLRAENGTLRMQHTSKQTPKPGYCDIRDHNEKLLFQLYFDGGGERKLQIKNLIKSECIVHAYWVL